MTDREFAEELVRRLNDLISDEPVREMVQALIERRVPASRAVAARKNITGVYHDGGYNVGILGVLNGCFATTSVAVGFEHGKLTKFKIYKPLVVCA